MLIQALLSDETRLLVLDEAFDGQSDNAVTSHSFLPRICSRTLMDCFLFFGRRSNPSVTSRVR